MTLDQLVQHIVNYEKLHGHPAGEALVSDEEWLDLREELGQHLKATRGPDAEVLSVEHAKRNFLVRGVPVFAERFYRNSILLNAST